MPFQAPGAPMYQQPAGFQPGQPPMGGPPNPWGQYAAYGAGGGYPGYGTTPAVSIFIYIVVYMCFNVFVTLHLATTASSTATATIKC